MGYTIPPMPVMQVPVGNERPPVPESMQRNFTVQECAYCRTPKASPYVPCVNCGAYAIESARVTKRKLSPPPLPKPIVTQEWR